MSCTRTAAKTVLTLVSLAMNFIFISFVLV